MICDMKDQVLCAKKIFCKRQNFRSLSCISTAPFETGNDELNTYLRYFLHRAPNISSAHASKVSFDLQNELFEKMFEGRNFVTKDFCSFNCKIEKKLSNAGMNSNNICLNCSRLVCKKKKPEKGNTESEFNCLLRHLRNSIAHGHFYYLHAGNRIFLVFDDFVNAKQTARIVCLRADLEHWYRILTSL